MATVSNALREDSIGAGLDLRLGRRFSVQTSAQLARISDDNEWVQIKPQISYRLFGKPGTFIRLEYDYLDYSQTNTTYWTPRDRSVVSPIFDTSIPLGKNIRIVIDARAPYVFDESEFGFQGQGGLVFDFRRIELKASYLYCDIPGDQGAWSGQGGQASVLIRF